ncbi:hypothetical protein GH714_006105 [Hevea brasiliensis]|uniref:Uncharacterized protein n=1 Tax=Hevea brasiliensis TaxID=3981 RepID=A0A6A6MCQ0_HEVBR|nr:hypothetical protein GH714_006105 [Hevea brasiliensis]
MEGAEGDAASTMTPLAKLRNDLSRAFQYYLDRSTPHPMQRWLGTLATAAIYTLRVYYVQVLDGASLPTKESDEFKPFIRRLPEFKFW